MRASAAASPHRRGWSVSGRASLALRLGVYLNRVSLDRRLAAGAPWDASAALGLRAEQLGRLSARRRIARDLRGLVDYVDRIGSRFVISAVVVERAAVADGSMPILRLAERLEDPARVSPRGVALARELLTDGSGPFFYRECGTSVAEAVLVVEDALEDGAPMIGFNHV